jgi:hypothetical protein
MDAIKKKMQAMKVEKDNAMDRADVCEQAAKDAKVRLQTSCWRPVVRCAQPRQRRRLLTW